MIEAKKREIGGEVLFPRSSFREIGRSSFQEIEGSGKRKKCPDLDHICIMITLINTGINNVIVTVLSFSLSLLGGNTMKLQEFGLYQNLDYIRI